MSPAPALTLADSGEAVRLGPELGRGGEGAILPVLQIGGRPDLVAKVYHRPPEPRKADKLRAMTGMAADDLLAIAAWPVDLLLRGGAVHGFVMPVVRARRDVHELYSPKSRFEAFPAADFRFLLHVGANVARAFGVVHARGHVIGDVNHGSVLVGPDGTVRLIDCDSFQVTTGEEVYTCDVGVPLFTPPELHGRPFRGLARTPEHDGFGLAVLLFHLLFMGRHPFAGRYRGRGDMPIERAVAERRFAYGPGRFARDMERPPGTLPLDAMGPETARLFVRAFTETSRPGAGDWVTALERTKAGLRACGAESSHHYPGHLTACPWCALEKATGLALFGHRIVATSASGTVDLARLWQAIERVPDPGPDPPLPMPIGRGSVLGPPEKLFRQVAALVLVVIGISTCNGVGGDGGWSLFLLMAATAAVIWPRVDRSAKWRAEQELSDARAELDRRVARFQAQASREAFVAELAGLRQARADLVELPKLRARKLAELRNEPKQRQLARYLDRFRIDRAKIPGIGPSRTAMLTSYGLESAADLDHRRIVAIPGFGDVLAGNLLQWRSEHSRRFRYNPDLPIDPRDLAAVHREVEDRRRQLVQRLRGGPATLDRIRRQVVTQRPRHVAEIERARQAVEEARLRLRSL